MNFPELKDLFESSDMISSRLLEPYYYGVTIPEDYVYPAVCRTLLLIELISKLGWVEHTSDWDLNMMIKTRDGKEVETGYGYGDCVDLINPDGEVVPLKDLDYLTDEDAMGWALKFDHTQFDDDDPDLYSWEIKIHNIAEIGMDR